MALVIDIADAVTAELNAAPAGTFDPAITAVRRVLPAFELTDLAALQVSVVPTSLEVAGSTRAMRQHDVTIDIGVQKKLGVDLDTEVAGLCGLVQAIGSFLAKRTLTDAPYACWVRSVIDPIFATDHLAGQRVFTSVLSVTYRMVVA